MQSTTNKGSPTAGNATASGHGQPFGRSAGGHGRGHGTGTGAVQQSLRGRGFDEQVQLLAPRGAVVQRDAAEPASASAGAQPAAADAGSQPVAADAGSQPVAADAGAADAADEALTLTVNNFMTSPGGSNKRTTVGVGEVSGVDPTLDGGTWTCSGGSGATQTDGMYKWTAPDTAGSYTVTCTVGAKSATVTFKVVAPKDITGKKTAEVAYGAGMPGSGMKLDLLTNPNDVSFTNLGWREVQGAIKGEGSLAANPPTIKHNAAWSLMGAKNDIQDTAEMSSKEFKPGKATYTIKEQYRVGTAGTPVEYTTLDQEFEIFDTDGTMQTRKAGQASDKRKPS